MKRLLTSMQRRGGERTRAKLAGRKVRIWSAEHGAWWCPDRAGYTPHVEAAGIYAFEDAWSATSHCGPEKRIVFVMVEAEERRNIDAPPEVEHAREGRGVKSNDRMIRAALVARLLDSGLTRDCIRHEITLDSSSSDGRADLVIIRPGYLVGVEIKSGVDTLNRLAEQRPRYSARFDRVVLVCDEKHKPWSDYHSHWQGWDGVSISLRDGKVAFPEQSYWDGYGALLSEPRYWSDRSGHLSPRAMLEMLWAAEITAAAGTRTRTAGIAHLAESRPLKEIRALVCDALRTRQFNRWEEKFWREFDAARVAPAFGGQVAERAAEASAP